jgi:hypothetical protein
VVPLMAVWLPPPVVSSWTAVAVLAWFSRTIHFAVAAPPPESRSAADKVASASTWRSVNVVSQAAIAAIDPCQQLAAPAPPKLPTSTLVIVPVLSATVPPVVLV